jgi:pSer/pThr/pTyr-binding forkhead associated (FHA) protein
MNFQFNSQGATTYLEYQMQDSDTLDSLSLGMVSNNHIKGVAPIVFTQMDVSKYLKYDVTAKVPVAKFFAGAVTKKRLLSVLSGIAEAILAAEEYMIDPSLFVIDLNYIFVNTTTCETLLICLPVSNDARTSVNLAEFFKNIVFSTQYDQTESNDYVAKVFSYFNATINFSLSDFATMVKELLNGAAKTEAVQPQAPAQAPQQVAPTYIPSSQQQHVPQQPVYQPPVQASQQPANQSPTLQVQQQSFAVPGTPIAPQNAGVSVQPSSSGEKEISLFQLLMHYNKENKAKYQAQKKLKAGAAPQQKQKAQQTSATSGSPVFAIPGQETSMPQAQSQQQPAVQPIATPQQQYVPQPQATPQYQQLQQQVVPTKQANFGGTTVLAQKPKGTVVLGVNPTEQQLDPHLLRIKNNERIKLGNTLLRVGRDNSLVEYCIGDNDAISGYHADFLPQNGEYFVTDVNSRNHTYVDGVLIQSMKAVKLVHGTKIKLANEDFEFRLY